MIRCFRNTKYFTHTILACFELFSKIICPKNFDVTYIHFQTTFFATIHLPVESLCLTIPTKREVCLSKLRRRKKEQKALTGSNEQQKPKSGTENRIIPPR